MVAGRAFTRAGASVITLLAGAALVIGPACVRLDAQDSPPPEPPAERKDARARSELAREAEHLEDFSRAFRKVAALARPSVVSIDVAGPAATRVEHVVPGDDLLRRFFGDSPLAEAEPEVSSGTGVILAADGSVLTNDHVLGGDGAALEVTLHDGRSYRATVRGRDSRSDLALLKIESPPDDLVPAVLGDSDAIDVGDWVVAIGSPFGLQQTVTTGIVSAKSRANVGITEYEDFIQTDAALNPGNSGGPLLNLRGEVIGINTAIASRTGGFMGVGFAIPIRMASDVAAQLGTTGRVVRGWLGVAFRELTAQERGALRLGTRTGVLVFAITPGGPAATAGLSPGDVVLSLGGEAAPDPTRLRHLIARAAVGTPVALEVWRDGRARTVEVTPAELTREAQARTSTTERRRLRGPGDVGPSPQQGGLGARARALTRALVRQLELEPGTRGVVVTGVEPGSLAARAGLRAGLVIRALDGHAIETLEDLEAAVETMDVRRGVHLTLEGADGARRTVFVRESSPP